MNIPPKYEDVVAQLDAAEVIIQAGEHVESHLEKQIDILRIDLDAALGREAALLEELRKWKEIAFRHSEDRDEIQQRLTVAERALGGMLFAFDDGVGREWSAPLLDFARTVTPAIEFKAALKPAAEGEGS